MKAASGRQDQGDTLSPPGKLRQGPTPKKKATQTTISRWLVWRLRIASHDERRCGTETPVSCSYVVWEPLTLCSVLKGGLHCLPTQSPLAAFLGYAGCSTGLGAWHSVPWWAAVQSVCSIGWFGVHTAGVSIGTFHAGWCVASLRLIQ